jgi:uracil-DNA glycosylase
MSNMPVSDIESTRRREDMLRELNIYPLWQRRAPLEVVSAECDMIEAEEVAEIISTETAPQQEALQKTQSAVDASVMSWASLKKTVKNCSACSLRAGCLQTVFGSGDENADWLFVGSWPTEDDESSGQPFSGAAGQLLDNMLAAIKLKRDAKVYLSNVVKCSGSITRGPQAPQIAQCAPYLARQIQLLKPKLIVVLGHSAATAMLGEDREWGSLLGKMHEYKSVTEKGTSATIPLIITHHPAALLLSPLNKAQTWRDLCLARDTMQALMQI